MRQDLASVRILDDDGVVVIASEAALRHEFADREFDYHFPNELLTLMRRHLAFGWHTGGEGEYVVDVEADHRSGTGGGRAFLRLLANDRLLVLPYSQFTYGSDRHGEFSLAGRLGAAVSVPGGWYGVRLTRTAPFQFLLTLTPSPEPSAEASWADLPSV